MIYTIDNGKLRLEVSSLGAEMQRLSSRMVTVSPKAMVFPRIPKRR